MPSLARISLSLLAGATLAACGPALAPGRGAAQRPFVVLPGPPLCTFQALQEIRVSTNSLMTPRGLEFRARNMGADAIMDFHEDLSARQYGPRGQILSRTFEGTAIRFSDPDNPDCYR